MRSKGMTGNKKKTQFKRHNEPGSRDCTKQPFFQIHKERTPFDLKYLYIFELVNWEEELKL